MPPGLPCLKAYNRRHRFRRMTKLVPYDSRGTDGLICDFLAAVETACWTEGVAFQFETEDVKLEPEDDDGTEEPVDLKEEICAVMRGG